MMFFSHCFIEGFIPFPSHIPLSFFLSAFVIRLIISVSASLIFELYWERSLFFLNFLAANLLSIGTFIGLNSISIVYDA